MRCATAVLSTLLALTQVTWPGVAAFQMFGHGGGSASPPAELGDTVRFLVRTVDAPDPYYRSMSFFVPKELNYMLGEYLHKNFSRMLERHCNVTNITMLVRNDVQLLLNDYDVWTLRNGDRIEIWSKLSGRPTRAQTAMAFAQKYLRPDPCAAGTACRGNRRGGGKWKTGSGGDDAGILLPDESAKMTVATEVNIPAPEEPIVVPDWSQMP